MILNMSMKNKTIIRPYQAQDKNACLNIIKSNTPQHFAQDEGSPLVIMSQKYGVKNYKPPDTPCLLAKRKRFKAMGGGALVLRLFQQHIIAST